MSDGFDLVYKIIDELKVLGKAHKIKAAKLCLGLYQNDKNNLWGTRILPWDYPSRPYLSLEVSLFIKPTAFDEIDRTMRCVPNEKMGDALNSNIRRAFYNICNKSYEYDRDKLKNREITPRMIAQTLLDDAVDSLRQFHDEVKLQHGDIFRFFISREKDDPMMAGLAYVYLKQYDKALKCFKYSEISGKYWTLSFGSYKRYYHLIAIDYCKIMQKNIEWKEEYVAGGIARLKM